jgi:hypothetical protein
MGRFQTLINRTGPQLTDKNRLIMVTNRLGPKPIFNRLQPGKTANTNY